jgi:hypothetical protein
VVEAAPVTWYTLTYRTKNGIPITQYNVEEPARAGTEKNLLSGGARDIVWVKQGYNYPPLTIHMLKAERLEQIRNLKEKP